MSQKWAVTAGGMDISEEKVQTCEEERPPQRCPLCGARVQHGLAYCRVCGNSLRDNRRTAVLAFWTFTLFVCGGPLLLFGSCILFTPEDQSDGFRPAQIISLVLAAAIAALYFNAFRLHRASRLADQSPDDNSEGEA
jgi:hypothetical protein